MGGGARYRIGQPLPSTFLHSTPLLSLVSLILPLPGRLGNVQIVIRDRERWPSLSLLSLSSLCLGLVLSSFAFSLASGVQGSGAATTKVVCAPSRFCSCGKGCKRLPIARNKK